MASHHVKGTLAETGVAFLVAAKTVKSVGAEPDGADGSAGSGGPPYRQKSADIEQENAAVADLMSEALLMAQVGQHKNLVTLVGVVTVGSPAMLLVSFCEHGSLLELLREYDASPEPSSGVLRHTHSSSTVLAVHGMFTEVGRIKMLYESAQGMAWLALNGFVHRDLAARNVLVDSKMACRVADFGLSRGLTRKNEEDDGNSTDEYYRSTAGVFPVRSTAPEAMLLARFTQKSDIWSWAILGIEIYTDGSRPFPDVTIHDLPTRVMQGLVPDQPAGCSNEVYGLLKRCWAQASEDRPDFATIVEICEDAFGAVDTVTAPGSPRPSVQFDASPFAGRSPDRPLSTRQSMDSIRGGANISRKVSFPPDSRSQNARAQAGTGVDPNTHDFASEVAAALSTAINNGAVTLTDDDGSGDDGLGRIEEADEARHRLGSTSSTVSAFHLDFHSSMYSTGTLERQTRAGNDEEPSVTAAAANNYGRRASFTQSGDGPHSTADNPTHARNDGVHRGGGVTPANQYDNPPGFINDAEEEDSYMVPQTSGDASPDNSATDVSNLLDLLVPTTSDRLRSNSEYGRTMRTTTPAMAARAISMLAAEMDDWDCQPQMTTVAHDAAGHVSYSTETPSVPPRPSLRGNDPRTAGVPRALAGPTTSAPRRKRSLPKITAPTLNGGKSIPQPTSAPSVPAVSAPRRKRSLPSVASSSTFTALDIGLRVTVENYDCDATLRYIGVHPITSKPRCGVELDAAIGKNNGTVKGIEYFVCRPEHGVLCAPGKVRRAAAGAWGLPTLQLATGNDSDTSTESC
jgi:serine/threonine protein kinase